MAHRRDFAYKKFTTKAPVVNFYLDHLSDFQVNDIPILTAADELILGLPVTGVHPDGATITGTSLQLNLADGTNPGMVGSISTPYSGTDGNGVKLTGGVLQLQLADGTHPGVLAGTSVGVPYVGTDANGVKFTAGVLQAQYANPTSPGIVNGAGNQVFGGVKSFSDVDLVNPNGKMTYGGSGTPLLQVGSNVLPSLYQGLNSGVNLTTASNTIFGNNGMTATNIGTENAGFGYGTFGTTSGASSHGSGFGCGTLQNQTNASAYNCTFGVQGMQTVTSGPNNCGFGAINFINLKTGRNNSGFGHTVGQNYTGAESDNLIFNSQGVTGESQVIRLQDKLTKTNALATACFVGGIATKIIPTANVPTFVQIDPTNDQLGAVATSAWTTILCTANNLTDVTDYTVLPIVGTYAPYSVAVAAQGVVVPPGDYEVIVSAQMGNCSNLFCLFNSKLDSDGTTVNWTRSAAYSNGGVTGATDSRTFIFAASVAATSRFQFTLRGAATIAAAITQANPSITIKRLF